MLVDLLAVDIPARFVKDLYHAGTIGGSWQLPVVDLSRATHIARHIAPAAYQGSGWVYSATEKSGRSTVKVAHRTQRLAMVVHWLSWEHTATGRFAVNGMLYH